MLYSSVKQGLYVFDRYLYYRAYRLVDHMFSFMLNSISLLNRHTGSDIEIGLRLRYM